MRLSQRRAAIASTWKLRAAYGAGDAGFNFCCVLLDTFLIFFCTEIAHLPAWGLGVILITGRICDVVMGVVAGVLADRTRSRFGSFRPWMFCAAPVLLLSMSAVFAAPGQWPNRLTGSTSAVVWVALSYGLLSSTYAAANVAYTAVLSVVTLDASERTALASARFAFAAAAVFLVNISTFPLAFQLGGGDAATGWQRTALLYGFVAAALLLVCVAGTRERVRPSRGLSTNEDLYAVLRTRGFLRLVVGLGLCLAAFGCRGAIAVLYFRNHAHLGEHISLLLGCNTAAAFVSCAMLAMLPSSRVPRYSLAHGCCAAGLILSTLCGVSSPSDLFSWVLLQTAFGFTTGPLVAAIMALLFDLPARSPGLLGHSVSGVISSAAVLMLKLGSTAGVLIVSQVLAYVHFQPGASQASQSGAPLTWLLCFVPAAFFALAAMLLWPARSS